MNYDCDYTYFFKFPYELIFQRKKIGARFKKN